MDTVCSMKMTEQDESIASFESTIRKLESALAKMTEQGSNTTVVARRLEANRIGLAVLNHCWLNCELPYTTDELASARDVLDKVLPSVRTQYDKFEGGGSPQKTVTERRIRACERAIQLTDQLLATYKRNSCYSRVTRSDTCAHVAIENERR